MNRTKELEIAYKLAKEWDYCPDASMMDEVIKFLDDPNIGDDQQENLLPILDKYGGSTPEEIKGELFAQLQAENKRLEEELVQQKEYVAAISNQFSKSVMATQQFHYPKSICKNLPPEQFSGFNACLSCPMVETCRLLYKRKENEK